MENKKCSSCKQIRIVEEFGKSSRAKDGKRSQCKLCEAEYRLTLKISNKSVEIKKCSTCKIEKKIENFSKNSSQKDNYCNRCKSCVKKHYDDNADLILKRNSTYRKENSEKHLKSRRLKYQEYYSKPIIKLSINISNLIRGSLKNNKSQKTEDILKCTVDEFKRHIESQFLNWMSWSNHGNCGINEYNCSWDLDHIIPISYAKTEEEVYLLNHWSNFQPLCSKINRGYKNNNIYSVTNLELKITINN